MKTARYCSLHFLKSQDLMQPRRLLGPGKPFQVANGAVQARRNKKRVQATGLLASSAISPPPATAPALKAAVRARPLRPTRKLGHRQPSQTSLVGHNSSHEPTNEREQRIPAITQLFEVEIGVRITPGQASLLSVNRPEVLQSRWGALVQMVGRQRARCWVKGAKAMLNCQIERLPSRILNLVAMLQLTYDDVLVLIDRSPKVVLLSTELHEAKLQALCAALEVDLPMVVERVVCAWPSCLLLTVKHILAAPGAVAKLKGIGKAAAQQRLLAAPYLLQKTPYSTEGKQDEVEKLAEVVRSALGVELSPAAMADLQKRGGQRRLQRAVTQLQWAIDQYGAERLACWVRKLPVTLLLADLSKVPTKVSLLKAALGLTEDSLLSLADRFPLLLCQDVGTTMRKVTTLSEVLDLDLAGVLWRVVRKSPGCLMLSLPAIRLAPAEVAQQYGMSRDAAVERLRQTPSLLHSFRRQQDIRRAQQRQQRQQQNLRHRGL